MAQQSIADDVARKMCDCMMDDLAAKRTEGSIFIPSEEQQMSAIQTCTAKLGLETAAK